jgi:dihydroorotate dehydrogenase
MYKLLLRILFMMDAEKAHYFTLNVLAIILRIPLVYPIMRKLFFVYKPIHFLGITFPNRVGLAAGFDKNAKYLKEFMAMGFGHVEIGTVTPLPQFGNEKPRLFRLVKDEAIINRMGFNNDGADAIVERLKNRPNGLIVGGNIGKNKVTENENAQRDYEICFEKLYNYCDYFVVNVSSPNTPNLRALQDKEPLSKILGALIDIRNTFIQQGKTCKPILLKIAPDLSHSQLDDVIDIVKQTGIDGLVSGNTTISRNGLTSPASEIEQIGAGGLSGKVLFAHATDVLGYLQMKSGGAMPLVGVGGIDSAHAAKSKLDNGATLLQIYTGLIYKGPSLVKQIARL